MKKFFIVVLAAVIISASSFVSVNAATPVSIYNYDVENLISMIDRDIADYDIKLWGKNYFTYGSDKGRYCLVYVGKNKELHIGFRLNSDNSVRYYYVGISDMDNRKKYLKDLMLVFVSFCNNVGIDSKDYQALVVEMNDYIDYYTKNKLDFAKLNKRFYKFCSSINKNVYLQLQAVNNGKGFQIILGAEK